MEDTQTTYYLRSTVLGGAAVVELNGPGSMDTVNIYAGGQRIARERWGNISFEHTNPVTGSRVTSAGYSGYRGTNRQERDSFGAEIPNSNPYPSQYSYVDYKFGEQMYIEGGDPFDYSTGREIDGIPVSETEFQRRMDNGSAVGDVFSGGRYVGSLNFSRLTSFSRITITFDIFQPPRELDQHPELWPGYYVGSFTRDVEVNPGVQTRSSQTNSADNDRVRLTQTQVATLERNLQTLLADPECGGFIQAMLDALPEKAGFTTKYKGSLKDIFNRIKNGGGLWSGDTVSKGGLAITDPNLLTTTWDSQRMTPLITGALWQQLGTAIYQIHELTHVFTANSNLGVYGHKQMAEAALAAAVARNIDLSKALGIYLPSRDQFATDQEYDNALDGYFNKALGYACRKVKL